MKTRYPGARCAALLLAVLPLAATAAPRSVNERRAVQAGAAVEISNAAGQLDIVGWNRDEVQITGTLGDRVERVDISGDARRLRIRVIIPQQGWRSGGTEAQLRVHVPEGAAVEASVVSAGLRVNGVSGDMELQSVSGDIEAEVGGNLEAQSVSGNLRLSARNSHATEVRTVSGNANVAGPAGEVEASTVSGDMELQTGMLTKASFESVSGDIRLNGALAPGGRLRAESVSGNMHFMLAGAADGAIEIESFSGHINNCFGPRPVSDRYSRGSSLRFHNGNGSSRISIDTMSGNIELCMPK